MSTRRFANESILGKTAPTDTGAQLTTPAASPARKSGHRRFGSIEPRGARFRARYTGPDGKRYDAEKTFSARRDAEGWLATQRVAIDNETWTETTYMLTASPALRPKKGGPLLHDSAMKWIAERRNSDGRPLADRTAAEYRRLFNTGPLSELGQEYMRSITPARVCEWFAEAQDMDREEPNYTQAGHAYSLLSSIFKTAVADGKVPKQPCQISGASKASSGREAIVPTDEQVMQLMAAIAPDFKAAIAIAAWGTTRFGEMTELRRKDLDVLRDEDGNLKRVVVRISRAVVHTAKRGYKVKGPKSKAGERAVLIPSHVRDVIVEHLDTYVAPEPGALLFPSRTDHAAHLSPASFYDYWYPAREAIGQPNLTFHGLRHYAGTTYAQAGATMKETQTIMGHNTPAAFYRYQHVAEGRIDESAARVAERAAQREAVKAGR